MRFKSFSLSLLIFLALFCAAGAQQKKPDVEMTLVVFNSRDPVSAELAKYYADKRKIAADHIIGIPCATTEEISRTDYDKDIAEPMRKILVDQGFWRVHQNAEKQTVIDESQVRFVVLMRGMPLKIAPATEPYEGDKQTGPDLYASKNEASVDSELAGLGFYSRIISGATINPYFRSYTRITDANFPQLLLVCRLDAPEAATVKRMIDDSLAAEKTGLWGFAYIDSRNIKDGGLARGDKWLTNIAEDARKHGIPVIHDNGPAVFDAGYPIRNAAFYYGWYEQNAYGPFLDPDFCFSKGAIACHIHSFSASTVRDPDKNWVGPLVSHGAAAAIGNVYEPFLALTTNLDIFQDRIESGFTFAESCYMSTEVVSWMSTFVGDPLYKPFNLIDDNFEALPKPLAEFSAYRAGAVAWYKQGRAVGEKKLLKAARELRSGIVYEALGTLQAGENDFTAAIESYDQSRKSYKDYGDIVRATIHEISILRAMGKYDEAHDIAKTVLKDAPVSQSTVLLRKIDAEMDPKPTPKAK